MNCPIFEVHQFNYDSEASTADKSVFVCICGKEQIEHEDSSHGG